MNVREAIETIGMQRLAGLAGCTRTTIDRTKVRGDVSSSPTGARIRQAIRDEGIVLDGDVPTGGVQPDLPIEQPIVSQIKDAELRQKMAADGDDVLFYEPDREVLAEFMRDRIRPAVIGLADGAITEGATDGRLKKRDSAMAIRFAGGGKILGLTPEMKTGKSAYTAPMVVLDEVDKMCDLTMFTVAKSRTTAYQSDACVIAVSPPTMDEHGTPPAKREQA